MKKTTYIPDEAGTTLGSQTVFNGTIRFDDSLRILGHCEGHIESKGSLAVEKGAEVVASIKVGSLVVGGTIKGDIEAVRQVELLPSGKVYGNIRTSQLKMADGVVFEGKVEMLKNADGVDVFSANPTQLKQSLEVL